MRPARTDTEPLRYIALVCFLAIMGCAHPDIEPTVEGNVLRFDMEDLDGNRVTSSDARFNGKVVLVDIWGTWCPACRKAIPQLVKLQEEYKADGLVVLGAAFEEGPVDAAQRDRLRQFVADHGINYTILTGGDPSQAESAFPTLKNLQGLPTMVIIGRDGKVAHANTVFVPREEPRIRVEVVRALGVSAPR